MEDHNSGLHLRGSASPGCNEHCNYEVVRKVKGRVDIAFENAGVVDPVSLTDSTPGTYDKHFNLNARGVYFTVQKALPLLANNGSIILSGSAAWQLGVPNYGPIQRQKRLWSPLPGAGSALRPQRST